MLPDYVAEHRSNLLWLDLEMTGLDPGQDQIIEVAMVATDQKLEILAESPTWVLSCPAVTLAAMDDWNKRTHGRSGLLDEVRKSTLGQAQVEQEALAFAKQWARPHKSPMCGSTIYQDRRFLAQYMPTLEHFFHYRNFDVTSFKLAAVFLKPALIRELPAGSGIHRASSDVIDSIMEMRYYQKRLLNVA